MKFIIVGLGNPGEEYLNTRHNTGFMVAEHFRAKNGFPDWINNAKASSMLSEGDLGEHSVKLLLPQTFMNKSGSSVKKVVASKKAAERLVVVYDDLDLPLGSIKLSFGRGSGGHKGVESIIRGIGTKDFIRLRVGVSSVTPSGKIKKPKGEKAVMDFILKDFRKPEQEKLKKVLKDTSGALETIIVEGRAKAMNEFNSLI
jgi:peptidyl-tRNA hydrolase, PTH1 family